MIETLSVIAIISANLWVINKTVTPFALNLSNIPNNCVASWGVSTPVGSSNIKILAPPFRAFKISTRCRIPTFKSLTNAYGSTSISNV